VPFGSEVVCTRFNRGVIENERNDGLLSSYKTSHVVVDKYMRRSNPLCLPTHTVQRILGLNSFMNILASQPIRRAFTV